MAQQNTTESATASRWCSYVFVISGQWHSRTRQSRRPHQGGVAAHGGGCGGFHVVQRLNPPKPDPLDAFSVSFSRFGRRVRYSNSGSRVFFSGKLLSTLIFLLKSFRSSNVNRQEIYFFFFSDVADDDDAMFMMMIFGCGTRRRRRPPELRCSGQRRHSG
ncbi:hypothetical protein Hanom_Chr17g01569321 [Helianthus anomalus]